MSVDNTKLNEMYQIFVKYSELISHMKCSNRGGYKAPHKAIYLLTIIDLVEEGVICNNRFNISTILISKFAEVWRKHIGDSPYFNINIWNPIYYIEQNILRKEYNHGCENARCPGSIGRCNEVFAYIEIPSDLFLLLQEDEFRSVLRMMIIDVYITNNRIRSSLPIF